VQPQPKVGRPAVKEVPVVVQLPAGVAVAAEQAVAAPVAALPQFQQAQ
jgi:hypothetical protein